MKQKNKQKQNTFVAIQNPCLRWAAAVGALALIPVQAMAGAATWSTTNIQYLYGESYTNVGTGSEDMTASIITLEHANAWKYGDNFFFIDITNPDRVGETGGANYYGEISPRFSLSALTGASLSAGPIKDIKIATTLESGTGFHNYLYGIAVDLDILKMPVFQINLYARNEIGPGTDIGNQLTFVWLKPFSIGPLSMSFEGFFDYAFDMDHKEDNIITAPRLLVDIGKFWGASNTLQGGVEYQIWRNKYGIEDVDEDVAQAMLKWIW